MAADDDDDDDDDDDEDLIIMPKDLSSKDWCWCCFEPHDMTTCEKAKLRFHPSLLSFASPEEFHAKWSALLSEEDGEDRDARRAKWMKEVEKRGAF